MLRFRAWHQNEKKMGIVEGITWLDGIVDYVDTSVGLAYGYEVVLMASTGLLDNAGREIYEGDILSFVHPATDSYEVGVVEFRDGTFSVGDMWDDGTRTWTSIEILAKAKVWEGGKLVVPMKVIGNKYENPELLQAAPSGECV